MPVDLLRFIVVAGCLLSTFRCYAGSTVRIVRISRVSGEVKINRSTGNAMEHALLNLPITQGTALHTECGVASVEFEDLSTLSLAPTTSIEVPRLALDDTGNKLSAIQLQSGTLYIHYLGTKQNLLTATAGGETIAFSGPAYVRILFIGTTVSVAVFRGKVEVTGPSGNVTVRKDHSADFSQPDNTYTLVHRIEKHDYHCTG